MTGLSKKPKAEIITIRITITAFWLPELESPIGHLIIQKDPPGSSFQAFEFQKAIQHLNDAVLRQELENHTTRYWCPMSCPQKRPPMCLIRLTGTRRWIDSVDTASYSAWHEIMMQEDSWNLKRQLQPCITYFPTTTNQREGDRVRPNIILRPV